MPKFAQKTTIFGGAKCEKSLVYAIFCGMSRVVFHRETPYVSYVKRSVDQIEMGWGLAIFCDSNKKKKPAFAGMT